MNLDYVPLLRIQRELQGMPRNSDRFKKYLRMMKNEYDDELGMRTPLVYANPMAKDHVTALLDSLLQLNADGIGARVAAEASAEFDDIPRTAKATLVVADDLMGGGTNRYDYEFQIRFQYVGFPELLPRWLRHFWITGLLWSSEPASEKAVREALLTAIYRTAYVHQHSGPGTLRGLLIQEGIVMRKAGCTSPVLDAEDIAYTREVMRPFLDATDKQTIIECMFGDAAGKTLGFTPRGLSHWAGLALALHDS